MKRLLYFSLPLMALFISGCAVGAGFQIGPQHRCVGSAFYSEAGRDGSKIISATQVGKHRLAVKSKTSVRKD